MDEMRELLDERQVEQAILLLGLLGPVVGLVGGVVYAQLRSVPLRLAALRGLGLGLLGTLTWGMWRLFSWLVRYEPAPDPKDDYFGLERVDILLLNVVLFVAVGALVGWVIRKVMGPAPRADEPVAHAPDAADAAEDDPVEPAAGEPAS